MIKLYGTPTCTYCVKSKMLLNARGIDYEEVDISQDTSAKQWILEQGHRTVPQLYIGEELIPGGYEGLTKYVESR